MKRYREEEKKMWLWLKWLKGNKCKRCGFSVPAVLQWHHKNKSEKLFTLKLLHRRVNVMNYKMVFKEIAKCDLLCANCHAIEHASNERPLALVYNGEKPDKLITRFRKNGIDLEKEYYQICGRKIT